MQGGRFYSFTTLAVVTGLGLMSACTRSSPPPTSAALAEPANRGYWIDPKTHLTWAAKDNGYRVSWKQATEFCQHLNTAGFLDWTLPTSKQLKTIYYVGENDFGHPVLGNIKLTADYEWSDRSGEAFYFVNGEQIIHDFTGDDFLRALCVRRAGE